MHSLDWGDKGFEIWADWSRSCPEKYDETDQTKTWESFDRPYDGPRITTQRYFTRPLKGMDRQTQKIDFHTDLGNARHLVIDTEKISATFQSCESGSYGVMSMGDRQRWGDHAARQGDRGSDVF